MARLTYDPLPALARLLEEERADADEAVSDYEQRADAAVTAVLARGCKWCASKAGSHCGVCVTCGSPE